MKQSLQHTPSAEKPADGASTGERRVAGRRPFSSRIASVGESGWSTRFSLPGIDGTPKCAIEWNGELIVGGAFQWIDGRRASNIAAWDGQSWSPLGEGCDGRVYDLAVFRGELFAAGFFNRAGSVAVDNVARWNGTEWSTLGDRPRSDSGDIFCALYVDGDTLYMGGAGHDSSMVVFPWDGSFGAPLFRPIPNFLDSAIWSIAKFKGQLYVGGEFRISWGDGVEIHRLARWTGESWEFVGGRLCRPSADNHCSGVVNSLLPMGDELWVGGYFTVAERLEVRHLAIWDGERWHPPPMALPSTWSETKDLFSIGSEIVVAGRLTEDAGEAGLARWTDGQWSLETELRGGSVQQVTSVGDRLLAVGEFSEVSGQPGDGVAFLEPEGWKPIPISGEGDGLRGSALVMVNHHGHQVVGGSIVRSGRKILRGLARWGPDGWESIGVGVNGVPHALYSLGDSLIVGGRFSIPGVSGARNIAIWKDGTWETFGDGVEGEIHAVTEYRGEIVCGGPWIIDWDGASPNLQRWNGTNWIPMTRGIDRVQIEALMTIRDTLYAGGDLRVSNHQEGVMRWNGDKWEPMGDGLQGRVYSFEEYEGSLVAGGRFWFSGQATEVRGLARWTGSEWVSLGDRRPNPYAGRSLAAHGRTLVVGSETAIVPNPPSSRPLIWDGIAWSTLDSGVSDDIWSVLIQDGELWVGGTFALAGGLPSQRVAVWSEETTLIPIADVSAIREGTSVRVAWSVDDSSESPRFHLYRLDPLTGNRTQLTPQTLGGNDRYEVMDSPVPNSPLQYLIEEYVGRFTSEVVKSIDVAEYAAVVVESFRATRSEDAVDLVWVVSDPDRRGRFQIYRELQSGAKELLTEEPISGLDVYEFADTTAPAEPLRYYLHQFVDGEPEVVVGPIAAPGPPPPRMTLSLGPNPARGDVKVFYRTVVDGTVLIRAFDPTGRRVATLYDGWKPAGRHETFWGSGFDNEKLFEGVYVIRLDSGGTSLSRKLIWFE